MCLGQLANQLGAALDQVVDLGLQVKDPEVLGSRLGGGDLIHQVGLSLQQDADGLLDVKYQQVLWSKACGVVKTARNYNLQVLVRLTQVINKGGHHKVDCGRPRWDYDRVVDALVVVGCHVTTNAHSDHEVARRHGVGDDCEHHLPALCDDRISHLHGHDGRSGGVLGSAPPRLSG